LLELLQSQSKKEKNEDSLDDLSNKGVGIRLIGTVASPFCGVLDFGAGSI
jgi:predicted secreted protein